MDRETAKKYLERKEKDLSEDNITEVMKKGKIYGDPVAVVE